MTNEKKYRAAVLGATGVVGMRMASLLADHPLFEPVMLAASDASRGRRFLDVVSSRPFGSDPRLLSYRDMEISEPRPDACPDVDIVFDALPASVSAEVIPPFLEAGLPISSNASAFRSDPAVPLVIAEINADHLEILRSPGVSGTSLPANGAPLVANPNCVVAGLALVLAPLRRLGLSEVSVVTAQALSGAGYPGLSALAALGNVIPFIAGEEEKIRTETPKILGRLASGGIEPYPLSVEASCVRVPVAVGHTMCVTVSLYGDVEATDIIEAWESLPPASLPTAPRRPIIFSGRRDRPQPVLDAAAGGGMSVTVGGLERLPTGRWRFFALADNLMRGAAGAALMNAELLAARGMLG